MSKFDLEVIELVCNADYIACNEWAKAFRNKTLNEMISRYQEEYLIEKINKN